MAEELKDIRENAEEEGRKLTKAERKLLRKEEKKLEKEALTKKRTRRRVLNWAAGVLVVLGIVGLGVLAARNEGGDTDTGTRLSQEVTDQDWIKGNGQAVNTLVEYADLQCPACASFNVLVNDLVREEGERLRIVYRHYPLRGTHPHAQGAAMAAEAAGSQGKFWEMVDLLYERQSGWAGAGNPQDKFREYARELGLNEDQFKSDSERGDLADKIDQHYKSGAAAGVNSTPTFFLNGEKLGGYTSLQGFKDQVKSKLENAQN